jgi:single-strand DNA-binding protein
MARSINTTTLIGNVGNAPEIRTTPSGTKVAQFSLATSRTWKDAKGQEQEKTEWHKCVVWGSNKGDGLAGVVERFVSKGDKLYVSGRIEYRQYENKEKQTVQVTEINVTEVLLLGGGKGAAPAESDDDGGLPF